MDIETFIRRVTGEPEKIITRRVAIAAPSMLAGAVTPGGVMLTDLISATGGRTERRTVRYRHILGSPAAREVIEAWERKHPSHPLPADLREVVSHANGIHLWADVESGRAYVGLAPIQEWELARTKCTGRVRNQIGWTIDMWRSPTIRTGQHSSSWMSDPDDIT